MKFVKKDIYILLFRVVFALFWVYLFVNIFFFITLINQK